MRSMVEGAGRQAEVGLDAGDEGFDGGVGVAGNVFIEVEVEVGQQAFGFVAVGLVPDEAFDGGVDLGAAAVALVAGRAGGVRLILTLLPLAVAFQLGFQGHGLADRAGDAVEGQAQVAHVLRRLGHHRAGLKGARQGEAELSKLRQRLGVLLRHVRFVGHERKENTRLARRQILDAEFCGAAGPLHHAARGPPPPNRPSAWGRRGSALNVGNWVGSAALLPFWGRGTAERGGGGRAAAERWGDGWMR